MTENKIKEMLDIYDDLTKDIIAKAIIEFQKTYKDKYLSIKEIVDLLKKNIPNGIKIYDNLSDTFDAICSLESQEFKVNRDILEDKEYFSYVFFHEFIHAISFKTYDKIRYMGFYSIEKGEDYEFQSKAFNEAFTEYLTLKRNKKYNYQKQNGSLSGYDLGASQIEMLSKIIGEEELIDAYFNKPYELKDIFYKHGMNIDEIFYSIHVFEGKDQEIYNLTNKYGMNNVGDLIKIIDGERYLFYNFLDSFGNITNEDEFNNKWHILLSEHNLKYNFWTIDGIFRYGELLKDALKLKIDNNNKIIKELSQEKIDKYTLLDRIFKTEDTNFILKELNKIYQEDYNKYFRFLKDDFAILPYTFLDVIKNNYQLYDIEIYPRVYPYLEQEKASIHDVDFSKIECSEKETKIYIFNINGNNYVECNYDDTIINKKSNTLFELVYNEQIDVLDLTNNTYKSKDKIYECSVLY